MRTLCVDCDLPPTLRAWGLDPALMDVPQLIDPLACAPGKDGTQWIIDRVAKGSAETEVEQFSTRKEPLRQLHIP